MDEFSLAAPTHVAELKNGVVTAYDVKPEDFGLATQGHAGLGATSAAASLELIKAVFSGEGHEDANRAADIIALNAGAAIYVSGVADSFANGVAMAEDAISTGLAGEKLKQLAELTQAIAN